MMGGPPVELNKLCGCDALRQSKVKIAAGRPSFNFVFASRKQPFFNNTMDELQSSRGYPVVHCEERNLLAASGWLGRNR